MTDQGTTAAGMKSVVVSAQHVKREMVVRKGKASFAYLVCLPVDTEYEAYRSSVRLGYCSAGFCSTTQILGKACATDVDCGNSGSGLDVQIFCSPGGICGGGEAHCQLRDGTPSSLGESDACVSGRLLSYA